MATPMMEVRKPTEQEAAAMKKCPTWSKEASKFDWSYGSKEVCLILKGNVEVTCKESGQVITFTVGDLVTFPAGINVIWNIKEDVTKHYKFS